MAFGVGGDPCVQLGAVCARLMPDIDVGARFLKIRKQYALLHTNQVPAVPLDQPLGDDAQMVLHIAAPFVGRQQGNASPAALRAISSKRAAMPAL